MRYGLGAFLLMAGVGGGVMLAQSGNQPVPVSVAWPFDRLEGNFPTSAGEARFRVTADRGQVTNIELMGTARDSLRALAEKTIRTWKLEPAPKAVFDILIRHSLEGAGGCEHDFNQIIKVKWPDQIEVVSRKSVTICDPSIVTTSWNRSYSGLAGTLIVEGPGMRAIAGAVLSVYAGEDREHLIRTIRTDDGGRFRASGLPAGVYNVIIDEAGYQLSRFVVRIRPGSSSDPLEFAIGSVPIPKRPPQVNAGEIPSYPARARRAGAQGTVRLRLSMDGDEVIDVDADGATPELGAAAAANVRTWKFDSVTAPVLEIQFDYRLVPGDCASAGGPAVTMQLPSHVQIEAVGPCRPSGFK